MKTIKIKNNLKSLSKETIQKFINVRESSKGDLDVAAYAFLGKDGDEMWKQYLVFIHLNPHQNKKFNDIKLS